MAKLTSGSAEVKALSVGSGPREDAELESCVLLLGQGEGRLRVVLLSQGRRDARSWVWPRPDAGNGRSPASAGSARPLEAAGSAGRGREGPRWGMTARSPSGRGPRGLGFYPGTGTSKSALFTRRMPLYTFCLIPAQTRAYFPAGSR